MLVLVLGTLGHTGLCEMEPLGCGQEQRAIVRAH